MPHYASPLLKIHARISISQHKRIPCLIAWCSFDWFLALVHPCPNFLLLSGWSCGDHSATSCSSWSDRACTQETESKTARIKCCGARTLCRPEPLLLLCRRCTKLCTGRPYVSPPCCFPSHTGTACITCQIWGIDRV